MARFRLYSVAAGTSAIEFVCEATDAADAERALGLVSQHPHHIVKSDGARHTIPAHTASTHVAVRQLVEGMIKTGAHPACRIVPSTKAVELPTMERVRQIQARLPNGEPSNIREIDPATAPVDVACITRLLAEFGSLNEALRCARIGVAVEKAVKEAQ